jgi:hypothetical protein
VKSSGLNIRGIVAEERKIIELVQFFITLLWNQIAT